MQFEVEAAGIAHRLSASVAPPQRGGAGVAVGAECPSSLADNLRSRSKIIKAAQANLRGVRQPYQSLLGPDQRPVLTVHLVVQPAGVAQVVSRPVPAPQGRCRGPAVDALSGLCAQSGSTQT